MRITRGDREKAWTEAEKKEDQNFGCLVDRIAKSPHGAHYLNTFDGPKKKLSLKFSDSL